MNTLPTNWYIEVTRENQAELNRWRKKVATEYRDHNLIAGRNTLLSEHPDDGSYYYSNTAQELRNDEDYNDYQEITLEQFRAITNPVPEHWYIEVTEDNREELNRWRLSKRTPESARWDDEFVPGATLVSKHPEDGSYFWKFTGVNLTRRKPYYKPITLEQFRAITNSNKMKHPEHWYIVATEDNYDELEAWRQTVARGNYPSFRIGHHLLSKHPTDDSYYFSGSVNSLKNNSNYNHYQEITIEQFRQITNTKPMSNPEVKTIQIPHSLLIEYYKAATTHQKEYLNIHFKLDGTTTDEAIRGLYDLACWDWKPRIKKNHPDCFPKEIPKESKYFDFSKHTNLHGCDSIVLGNVAESLGLYRNFIEVRSSNTENNDRSFYLDRRYNWELINEGGDMVLIPTKKVK